MNLVKFIDNRFQELRLKEQEETKKNAYSVTRDSEVMALQAVLKAFRTLTKWVMIPKVLGHYIIAKLGLVPLPRAVLLEKLEEEQKRKKESESVLAQMKADKEAKGSAIPAPL